MGQDGELVAAGFHREQETAVLADEQGSLGGQGVQRVRHACGAETSGRERPRPGEATVGGAVDLEGVRSTVEG